MPNKSAPANGKYLSREKLPDDLPNYDAYLAALDPLERADVQSALEMDPDGRFRKFLAKVSAEKKPIQLGRIAAKCGISYQEFVDFWSRANCQRALRISQEAAPWVMEKLRDGADHTWENCGRCDGLGFVSADAGLPPDTPGYRILREDQDGKRSVPVWVRECPACDGARKRRKLGEEFSREKILESAGLINKKGPMVAIQQNFGGSAHSANISKLDSALTLSDD